MDTEADDIDVHNLLDIFLNLHFDNRKLFIKLLVTKVEYDDFEYLQEAMISRNSVKQDTDLNIKVEQGEDVESHDDLGWFGGKVEKCEEFHEEVKNKVGNNLEKNQEVFICMTCPSPQTFSRKEDLKRHEMRIHTQERPYPCELCPKRFTQSYDLKRHMNTAHIQERPYKCQHCPKQFKLTYELTRHMKVKHEEFYNDYIPPSNQVSQQIPTKHDWICDICAENHISKSALAKHVKEVHDQIRERKHFCDQCPKAFTQKHSLVVHQRSHTGEKPYTCDICFKKFISAINHKVHQRIHRGEKPFLCDICSKTFRTTTHLKRHKARHTGEKPYPCEHCPKYFADKYVLRTHMRTHTGEKPFVCSGCSYAFSDISALIRHRKKQNHGLDSNGPLLPDRS